MLKEKNLKINVFFNMLKALMQIVFPIISFPYAARVLGVNNIGKVQYCTSIVGYFIIFAGLGIANYATREGTRYRDDKKELSRFAKEVLIINVVSTVVAYLILFVVSFYFLKSYAVLIMICSFMIVFTTFSIDWLYQIEEDFVFISIRTIVIQFLSLILLLLLVKEPEDYYIYAVITVVANGGNCVFNWLHSKKYVTWFQKSEILNFKRHIKPILVIFSISASASIYLNLDSVMIGALRGDYEIGLYSAATKLATVVKTVITSISAVLLSRLSFYVNNKDKSKYNELLNYAANCVLMIAIPSGIGLAVLRKEIIILFCGTEYSAATFASLILGINMIFSVTDGMIYNQIFLPLKLESQASVATITGAVSNFIMNYFFIKRWGFYGAAVTTLVSECIVFAILVMFACKRVKIKNIFSLVYQYIIGGFGIIFVCLICRQVISSLYIRILLSIGISFIIYFGVLLLFSNIYLKEIRKSLIDRLKKK